MPPVISWRSICRSSPDAKMAVRFVRAAGSPGCTTTNESRWVTRQHDWSATKTCTRFHGPRHDALGRRAPAGGDLPAAAAVARLPAVRRAHQPTRRGVGGVARALPGRGLQGDGRSRHPRPLLPRQRRGLDPGARPRAGNPWEGNYSSWLAQKQHRLDRKAKQETRRRRTLERELEWIAMSLRARQANIPPGPRLRDVVVEATELIRGYRDRVLIQGAVVHAAAGGYRPRRGPERIRGERRSSS